MSVGRTHGCAIDYKGNLFTWGRGEFGQLGSGEDEKKYPAYVKSLRKNKIEAVMALRNATVFLTSKKSIINLI